MQQDVLRRSVAEFVGAFTLIFIGGGAGIVSGSDIVAVALANGLAIGIMVSNLGHISGGHFNPAITLGFLATRRITHLGDAHTGFPIWLTNTTLLTVRSIPNNRSTELRTYDLAGHITGTQPLISPMDLITSVA